MSIVDLFRKKQLPVSILNEREKVFNETYQNLLDGYPIYLNGELHSLRSIVESLGDPEKITHDLIMREVKRICFLCAENV